MLARIDDVISSRCHSFQLQRWSSQMDLHSLVFRLALKNLPLERFLNADAIILGQRINRMS